MFSLSYRAEQARDRADRAMRELSAIIECWMVDHRDAVDDDEVQLAEQIAEAIEAGAAKLEDSIRVRVERRRAA